MTPSQATATTHVDNNIDDNVDSNADDKTDNKIGDKIDDNAENSQRLDKQLCHRLYLLSNAMTRAYRPLLNKVNLTYPQYIAMMALWQEDNIHIGELHKRTGIDNGCLSIMLKKMVDKGMVQLIAEQTDRRSKRVQLTDLGRALQAQTYIEKCKLQETYKSILEEEELSQLLSLLDKLKGGLV